MTTGYKLLTVNGERILEHRHIMEQYLGRKLEAHEHVHHIDGDPLNNEIENLELVSSPNHSRCHLGDQKGENNFAAKLTSDKVKIIKILLHKGMKQREIADAFNITEDTISDIKYDQLWAEVPWPNGWKTPTNPSFKLTVEQVQEIKVLLNSSMTQVEIAKKYGVTQAQISQIKRGKSWK